MRSLLVEAEPTQDAALVERLRRLSESERPGQRTARSRSIAAG